MFAVSLEHFLRLPLSPTFRTKCFLHKFSASEGNKLKKISDIFLSSAGLPLLAPRHENEEINVQEKWVREKENIHEMLRRWKKVPRIVLIVLCQIKCFSHRHSVRVAVK